MSKYTTQVRFICESLAGLTESKGYGDVNNIIETAAPKIFSFDFPIFDESYRSVLEKKILKHYYTREIGLETYGLWQLKLDTKMNEIMPYFNQRYKSETLEFNPLYDFDITRDHKNQKDETGKLVGSATNTGESMNTGTVTDAGTSSQTDDNTATRKNKFSDTPQGTLTNVENGTYLTNAEIDDTQVNNQSDVTTNNTRTLNTKNNVTNETTTNTTNTVNSTEDFIEHVRGKQSGTSYSKLLEEYRKTMLNIDMEVIDSLADLFMNLW